VQEDRNPALHNNVLAWGEWICKISPRKEGRCRQNIHKALTNPERSQADS